MVLIFVNKNTARKEYMIKHMFKRILQLEFEITTDLSAFIAHAGAKLSYGKKPLGEELFIWAHDLLGHTGIDDYEIDVTQWNDLPVFFQGTNKSHLPFDVFAASFYLITRYEEYLPQVKDELGRYSPKASLAMNSGFLEMPLIDLWSQRLGDLLVERFDITLSRKRNHHNHLLIDTPSIFKYKLRGPLEFAQQFFSQLSHRRLRDLITNLAVNLGLKKDPYDQYDALIQNVKQSESSVKVTYFFHLGNYSEQDKGVSHKHRCYQELIKHIADYVKVGIRYTLDARLTDIKKQSKRFEQITNRTARHSIAALGKISIPKHYKKLVDLEHAVDHSMGYEDQPGFRASTAHPFYFYDLDYEVQTPLLVNPYAIHYKSIEKYTLNGQEAIILRLKAHCKSLEMPFVMMLCNDQFESNKRSHIHTILKQLLDEV